MRAAKVDRNHAEIVDALRKVGCAVQSLAPIGKGCPDVLVSRSGCMWLMEIKDGSKPPSGRRLTDDQVRWHTAWGAPVYVVASVEQALEVVR